MIGFLDNMCIYICIILIIITIMIAVVIIKNAKGCYFICHYLGFYLTTLSRSALKPDSQRQLLPSSQGTFLDHDKKHLADF